MESGEKRLTERTAEILREIRERRPLVHNITNYVVMNYTANALLAVGASPVMAHAAEEVEEMVRLATALVVNIGTLSGPWVESMFLACRAARVKSIPIVLDPVGAGATRYRTETAEKLAIQARPTVIRGNASEILALSGATSATRGVDSVHAVDDARLAARDLAKRYETVVSVTGAEDYVTDGVRSVGIVNGHPMMGRITGSGCSVSAITGAFLSVESDAFVAAAGALIAFGIAGELAAVAGPGPGTYQALLLDALYGMEGSFILERARLAAA